MSLLHDDPQLLALRLSMLLDTLRADWGGALVLGVQLDPQGAALALAVSEAGGVSLTLEPDPGRARSALRSGACDFVVNTLDEALRALKNEVRQSRPLAVGLEGLPGPMLDEIAARGVAPQAVRGLESWPGASSQLAEWGAIDVSSQVAHVSSASDALPPEVAGLVKVRGWARFEFRFETLAQRAAFDRRAGALLAAEDSRQRWLAAAGRLFPRDARRLLYLTREEHTSLS